MRDKVYIKTDLTMKTEEIIRLDKIDGTELIECDGSTGDRKIEIGKMNILKLPVRYLENEARKNRTLYLPGSSNCVSEVAFIKHILGKKYLGQSIDIRRIQIFVSHDDGMAAGLPSAEHIQNVINQYSVTIADTHHNDAPGEQNRRFNIVLGNSSSTRRIINNSIGLSLPDGIIYLTLRQNPAQNHSLLIHEAFHQYQYLSGNKHSVFNQLVQEMWDNTRGMTQEIESILNLPQNYSDPMKTSYRYINGGQGPYYSYVFTNFAGSNTTTQSQITNLQQITTLEGQAQFIQDFTEAFLNGSNNLLDFSKVFRDNKQASGLSSMIFP